MDQNSNVNLKVVQADFSIKYGPKTLKHPWSISLKTLGHFEITILNTTGHPYFKSAFGINFGLWGVVKRKIRKYTYLHIFSLTTSRSTKLIPNADLK